MPPTRGSPGPPRARGGSPRGSHRKGSHATPRSRCHSCRVSSHPDARLEDGCDLFPQRQRQVAVTEDDNRRQRVLRACAQERATPAMGIAVDEKVAAHAMLFPLMRAATIPPALCLVSAILFSDYQGNPSGPLRTSGGARGLRIIAEYDSWVSGESKDYQFSPRTSGCETRRQGNGAAGGGTHRGYLQGAEARLRLDRESDIRWPGEG